VIPVQKTADYKKATRFLYKQNDSAFYYFNKAATTSKDSLQTAMAYNQMAAIQSDAGDYFGSQESLSMSLKFLDEQAEKDRKCLASDYNELGMNSFNLKNYDGAIRNYDQAIKYSENNKFRLIFLNNKANAYQRKGAYGEALALYRSTLLHTDQRGTEYARILSNMARTKWLARPAYNAAPELLKALQIRQKEKDDWGQNASYAHLADYYSRTRPDSALFFALKMYTVARKLDSPDDRLEALQKLIRLGPALSAKGYFERHQQLNDSLQTARNASKNQFALIRYDAEKHKAENLKLQKDNTEKRYQIIKQQILFGGISLLLVAGIIATVFWYRKRKQRLDLEARERELRISQKIHDVVANGLYLVMNEIENQDQIHKGPLLDQIEILYEQSRDISYEKHEAPDGDFHVKITKLLTAFAAMDIKIAVAGNNKNVWKKVSAQARQELKQVLQELMVNMKKHSHATSVSVRFEQQDNHLHINYMDNGVGFPAEVHYGNGLTNTGNRIQHMGGTITFDTKLQKGVKIHISLPLV